MLMTEMCQEYFPASNETNTERYPKMYSSDKQQFLYCIIPKVEYQSKMSADRVDPRVWSSQVKISVNYGGLDRIENSRNLFLCAGKNFKT